MSLPFELTPAEFDALTRLDFATFVERVFADLNPTTPYLDNFHLHLMAAALEAMRRGEQPRLIINVPPRNLKSIIVSVAYVAWLLGHDPTLKIICVSYGQELADSLARMCRQIMQSEWYQRLFPKTQLSPARLAVHAFETTAGGIRFATSIDGAITGFGANYILIDDPLKPQEALSDAERTKVNEWYRNTVITRLNDKQQGRIAILMQRLHEDDLVGYVQALECWKIIALPAIAQEAETHIIPTAFGTWTHHRREGEPLHLEREPLAVLERYRHIQGPEVFAAQFLQSPVPPGGNMIKLAWFQRFDLSAPPKFERFIHSWDTANKATQLSGYSVCSIWGVAEKRIYLVDVIRARFEYPDLRTTALALARGQHHRNRRPDLILIEDKASGQSLIQDLKREGIRNIEAVKPEADKVMRMHTQTATLAGGHVMIPTEAPWLADYLHEIVAFPGGRYTDQVDSTSQALKWFNYQPDEPGLIQYYRELAATIHGNNPEDKRIVAIRSLVGSNVLSTLSGQLIGCDANGIFLVPYSDAKPLLGKGWILVEES